MILGKNKIKIKDNWMNVPKDMTSMYMLYLATEIAENNNMDLYAYYV